MGLIRGRIYEALAAISGKGDEQIAEIYDGRLQVGGNPADPLPVTVMDRVLAAASIAGDVVASVVSGLGYVYNASTDTWLRLAGDTSGQVQVAGYTSGTTSNRGEEIDPVSAHHPSETLLDLENIAQTTTGYGQIDMDGARFVAIQGDTSGATPTDVLTVTLEASVQDDGTAPGSCSYDDVTSDLAGVASWVDTDFFVVVDTSYPAKHLRVKYTTSTGGGNDADLTVYVRKVY